MTPEIDFCKERAEYYRGEADWYDKVAKKIQTLADEARAKGKSYAKAAEMMEGKKEKLTAKWVICESGEKGYRDCSNCGRAVGYARAVSYGYCPYCGAEMTACDEQQC